MSTEMKKLIIGGTEYEIVDDAGRTRITALEQGGGGSGTGLTQTEKNLLLSLFEKAAYAEDDAGTAYTALSNLWTGYSITWSGTGYTKSNSAIAVSAGASFTSTVTANTGFTLTDVAVTMGGNTVQGAWSNGTVTIPNVTGDIVITVTTSQITVSSISAVYTQSGTVYDTDSLDSLKSDLVVTATFTDSTTGVIAAADYTLSGTLTTGTSTITVSYGGQTATFNVAVTEAPVEYLYNWDFTQSLVDSVQGMELELSNGATRDASGLHFTSASNYVELTGLDADGYCYELDIAEIDRQGVSHGRVFTIYQSGVASAGFIYRSTGVWAVYSKAASAWTDSSLTSPSALNGKTVTIKLLRNEEQSNKRWMYVYLDNVLIADGDMSGTNTGNAYIGSNNGQALYNMTITGLRIYANS